MKTILGLVITIALCATAGCVSSVDDIQSEGQDSAVGTATEPADEAIGEAHQAHEGGGVVVGIGGAILGFAVGGPEGAMLGWEVGHSVGNWATGPEGGSNGNSRASCNCSCSANGR